MHSATKLASRFLCGKFSSHPHQAIHCRSRVKLIPQRSLRMKPLYLTYAAGSVEAPKEHLETVGAVMTSGNIYTVTPDTPVLDALELLVLKRVTGLPVVDEENRVVGVVSDFDLLALDFHAQGDTGIFPSTDQSWETFRTLQTLLHKSEGRLVEDVMTPEAITVRAETSLESASRILLESKTRRLPVVDSEGRLIGVVTRRDIVVAALAARKAGSSYFTDDEDIVTMA